MIELFEQQKKDIGRSSSKGNQLKWENEGIWYKADYSGYEGLAETVVSKLLDYSDLSDGEYAHYETEEIKYGTQRFRGAKSRDILTDDWQIITLERLYKQNYNESLYKAIWTLNDVKERMQFLCLQTEMITGIKNFGEYMTRLLTIDAFFKNEDRHTHNIAVLMNSKGEFKLCPIFDNGAALLADTTMDYPLDGDIYALMDKVQAKTICVDFDEQLNVAEELYGQQIHFNFTRKDVEKILDEATLYDVRVRERVKTIIFQQMRKYLYLFD